MYFLIDYENVGSSGLQGAEYLEPGDTVVIFYSGSCEVMQYRYMQAVKEHAGHLECVRLKKKRKNALDMYIAVYTGQLLEREHQVTGRKDLRIAILSHDHGYESVYEYCEGYGDLPVLLCLCTNVEEAILRLDTASSRAGRIAELRRRVPIG